MTLTEWIAVGSLCLNMGIAVVGATWGIGKIRDAVRDAIEKHREKYDADLDAMGRSVGEGIAAIRQKVHEVETWARDAFVRKDSFESAMGRLEDTVTNQFDKIEARLERMEGKIDNNR